MSDEACRLSESLSTRVSPLRNIAWCIAFSGDCVSSDLVDEICAWPAANTGCDFSALVSYLAGRLNTPLSEPEVQNAVNWLMARGLAKLDGERLRLTEPDRKELELYRPLERRLNTRRFLNALNVGAGSYVLQDTSAGGAQKTGLLSKPDFTLATFRAGQFDKTLEIITIEVKNRAGSNINAVYDTRAHRHFSHFAYLACPRSRLNAASTDLIRATCETENVGLILFDIEEDGIGNFDIDKVKVEHKPRRSSPEGTEIDNFLTSRLTAFNCARLKELSRGE